MRRKRRFGTRYDSERGWIGFEHDASPRRRTVRECDHPLRHPTYLEAYECIRAQPPVMP